MASDQEIGDGGVKIKKYLAENIQDLSQVYAVHKKALENSEEEISQWKKFIKDYNVLQEKLTKYPDKTSYDEVIPIGSLAYMKGRMIHTNEILVHLGESWFTERSVKDAIAIINRRKEVCKKRLKGAERMKEIHEGWMKQSEVLAKEGDQTEILEQMTEEQYQQTKEKRREMLATHLSVTGESPVNDEEDEESLITGEIKSFEDLLRKLDTLEEQERLNDELEESLENQEQQGNDNGQFSIEGDTPSKGDKNETEEGGSSGPKEKLRRRVSWADQLTEPKGDEEDEEENGEECVQETPIRMKYRSRQQSLPTELISSSWNKEEPESPSQESVEASEIEVVVPPVEVDSEGITPQSPSDLYKMFGPHALGGQPTKGILKKKGDSFQTDDIEKGVGFCDEAESIEYIPCSPDEPVVFRTPPLSESPKEIKNLKPAFSYKVVARDDHSEEEEEEVEEEKETAEDNIPMETQPNEDPKEEPKETVEDNIPKEDPEEEPKHVSRFKAARMKKASEEAT